MYDGFTRVSSNTSLDTTFRNLNHDFKKIWRPIAFSSFERVVKQLRATGKPFPYFFDIANRRLERPPMRRFAHRGMHTRVEEENTLHSFRRALQEADGFECDVRLSSDGIPVVVHDATLARTHGVYRHVHRISADDLRALGVPTLGDVLSLLRSTRKTSGVCAILDLKVSEKMLMRESEQIARQLGVDTSALAFLVWGRMTSPPSTRALVLRAVEYKFHSHHRYVHGVACKYDGSDLNHHCIERALSKGLHVNLYAPDPSRKRDMLRRYGDRCTICF